jgi:hypothetical protein
MKLSRILAYLIRGVLPLVVNTYSSKSAKMASTTSVLLSCIPLGDGAHFVARPDTLIWILAANAPLLGQVLCKDCSHGIVEPLAMASFLASLLLGRAL